MGAVSPETAVLQANRSMGLTNENALHAGIFNAIPHCFESKYKD